MNQSELLGRCEVYQIEKIEQILSWGQYAHPNAVVLLGDSIFNRFEAKLLNTNKEIINCGIDGATSQTLFLVLNSIINMKPDQILFMIGTNDLDDEHEFDCLDITFALFNMITSIHHQLPLVKIGVVTPLPIDESRQKTRARNNRTLKMLGDEMKALKQDLDYVDVIDTFDLFLDVHGSMEANYTTDGLHLSEAGYQILAKKLSEFVKVA